MSFYDEMQGVATELLQEFKQATILYRTPTAGAQPWEPVTYNDTPISGGTVSGVSQRYVTDLVTTSDLHAILPVFFTLFTADSTKITADSTQWTADSLTTTPTNAGRLVIDGVERQIIRVMPSPAAGTVVCRHVFVKG